MDGFVLMVKNDSRTKVGDKMHHVPISKSHPAAALSGIKLSQRRFFHPLRQQLSPGNACSGNTSFLKLIFLQGLSFPCSFSLWEKPERCRGMEQSRDAEIRIYGRANPTGIAEDGQQFIKPAREEGRDFPPKEIFSDM